MHALTAQQRQQQQVVGSGAGAGLEGQHLLEHADEFVFHCEGLGPVLKASVEVKVRAQQV